MIKGRHKLAIASGGACRRGLSSWPESACELYQPNDRRFWEKILPTFADRGCHLVSVADPYGRILDFLDPEPYFFFQVAPQFYSRG
jgi:hypothetical protein